MIKQFVSKYKSTPLPVRAAAWFIVCSAVQNGVKFLSMPIILRLIPPDEYGTYSVFLSWTNIIRIFATLYMELSVFNNAMLKYSDRRDEYTSSAQSVSMFFTLVCFALYILFRGPLDRLFKLPADITAMIFVQLFFTEGFLVWMSRQRYEYVYKKLVVAVTAFSLSYLAVPVLCGYLAPPEKKLRAIIYGGVAVQAAFGIVFIIYNYIKGKCVYNKEFWKFAIFFNVPLIPHFLSGVVLGEADRVMIRDLVGSAEAGIYSFVYTVSIIMNIVTSAVVNAVTPVTYNALKRGKNFGVLRSSMTAFAASLGMLIIMFSCAAPEFIRFFATEDYYEAIYLVPVISMSSFFNFLYCIFVNMEFYYEKNGPVAAASVAAAAANIVLNRIFIPVFGYFAAGYTTLFCYILYSLMHFIFIKKLHRDNGLAEELFDGRKIFLISAASLLAAFGMLAIYDFLYLRYAVLAAALTVAFIKRKTIIKYFTAIREKDSADSGS